MERKCSQPKELKHEFWRVQWKAGSNRKCTIAELPQCGVSCTSPDSAPQCLCPAAHSIGLMCLTLQPLNRYYDSIPFDFNRVILVSSCRIDSFPR